jgi:hypothetical protein
MFCAKARIDGLQLQHGTYQQPCHDHQPSSKSDLTGHQHLLQQTATGSRSIGANGAV